jgi:Carboxypeptidase regulatory-like domain/TonB-dependent Receptor Plug Domain
MLSLRRLPVVLFLLAALPALAQTTGSISGHVTSSGYTLPDVTVEGTSPALQGSRVAVTDGEGLYHLPLLPPGNYTVVITLAGFASLKNTVVVSLGKETTYDATISPKVSEADTVVASVPIINRSTNTLGADLPAHLIETLPTGRNYSSVVQVTPGVSTDAVQANDKQTATITVYGSSGAENAFYVDGVNTTNAEYGFQGKELNFEFIDSIEVKTGGYEAEYGRATGGIINVVTKSGSNELHGDVFGYNDSDSLQTNSKTVIGGTAAGFSKKDYGADAGGFIIKEKLWFFAAYDQVRNRQDSILGEGPDAGKSVASLSHRDLGSAKLTWAFTPSHTFVGTFLQDPRADTGAINDANHTLIGEPASYLGREGFGGRDYALRYDGIAATSWLLSAQGARHRERNSVGPATSAGDVIEYIDARNDFFQTGGFGLIQDKSFDRKFYGGSATRYLGAHQIKGGIEIQDETADVVKRMSGGQQVDVFANPNNANKPIYSHFYWTTPDATVANAPVSALTASPQHRNSSAYLQDRWAFKNVTLNAGIRWDRQRIIDPSGVTQIDLKKDFAPRLGFVWDPTARSRAKVFGSYGRYYEEIPMDLVIRSFSYERQPRIINYSPTSVTPDHNAEVDADTTSAILGGFTEPSDPHLKNQYLTELIVGGEREVMEDISVGVKGIYRSYGRVIEDFLCADDGTYCIGNPGEGIMKKVFTLDYSQQFDAPKPKRTYKGIQFDATKRFNNNWQAMASYVYSKLEGNYDGEYAPFTNVGADPNISAAYDYYDFFTNGSDLKTITNHGPLSNDRRHQLKFSGIYNTPWKLSLGVSAYWRSGSPLTRYGYSDAYRRYEFFLTPRGAEGRAPSNYDADVHLGYPIALGGSRLNLLLDVFNLLNTQRPVLLDERYGFEESDNALPSPANPNYLKPVLRTPATSARLGVRWTF